MSEIPEDDLKPVVASYCTTFLKPEMRHIYRQVTGLQRHRTFVVTRERVNAEEFPFPEIEILPRARKNFLKRFWLKYIAKKAPVYYRGELQVLLRLLRRRPIALMHIYFGHTGVHLLPLIEEYRVPCVVSFHGMDIQSRPNQQGYDEQMRTLLQTVPLVLGRSRSLLGELERWGCPKEKLRLNRTGIPLDDFPLASRRRSADGAWRFVQACRLVAKKGLRTALLAFGQFHGLYPRSKFRIAGEGPMRAELVQMIGEMGLGEAVELRGFLGQSDLAKLYAESDIFLHPSEMPRDGNQEGVPNSMLEAMATGLPVLATTHGGIPEAVTHDQSGWLVPERDPGALFEAMKEIVAAGDPWARLGSGAARAVRAEFEQRAAVAQLENFYEEAREKFR